MTQTLGWTAEKTSTEWARAREVALHWPIIDPPQPVAGSANGQRVQISSAWSAPDSPLRDQSAALADANSISRQDLFELASRCRTGAIGWRHLFTASYAWGTGRTGYGRHRYEKIVEAEAASSASLDEKLAAAADIARDRGALPAYYYLNNRSEGRISFLGPAFFTKYLYFSSQGVPTSTPAPLILDRVVAARVRVLTGNARLLTRGSWTTAQYGTYLAYMERLAEELQVARTDDVEHALFTA